MSNLWEVDPETKTKLQKLQSLPPNKTCVDCSAPSPQWSSPKFGTFICLSCAGLHRGLGVHISFVRSVAMDSFKTGELARMEKGGNERWRDFWQSKSGTTWTFPGKGADNAAKARVEEVYGGDIGGEWKERLTCQVEEREFTGYTSVTSTTANKQKALDIDGSNPGVSSTSMSSSSGPGAMGQKERNEAFFAKKGAANASRPDGLRPSEGGKYSGFGSTPLPNTSSSSRGNGNGSGNDSMPSMDDLQKDPVAALSKGFGWFTGAAVKSAKNVNETWIQPTAQKLAEADLANQARQTAAWSAKNISTGAKGAADKFNNFIDKEGAGASASASSSSSLGTRATKGGIEPERKQFWDSFGDSANKDHGEGAGWGQKW